jgi:hypothetical protein
MYEGAVKKFPEFFGIDGLMRHEFVLPGQRVMGHFLPQVLKRLRDIIRRKPHDKQQR